MEENRQINTSSLVSGKVNGSPKGISLIVKEYYRRRDGINLAFYLKVFLP